MEAPLTDERGDGLAGNVIEPTARQRKPIDARCSTGGRDQLAEEPWLHRVLSVRSHVEQVALSDRADVMTDDVVRNGSGALNDMSRVRESHHHTEPPSDDASANPAANVFRLNRERSLIREICARS